ncbi:hypothetical protein [Arthrobacter sp. JCM 19049]|uniref:hypothetical protein n=1 Tax=Arthrobacter sp. JCM 19049 TaxID=1460643 RepID=UPI0024364603|nr:hypothetical protein [Arthrobacter sp. JCM 19049]
MEEKDGADQMTVTPIDPRELLKRWEAAKLPSVTPTQVRALLEDNYKAYGIPVHLMEPDGFEFDEEVREDLIDALFTITNPAVLLELRNGRPVAVDEDAVEDAEFYWQELFHGDMLELPYRVLSASMPWDNGSRYCLSAKEVSSPASRSMGWQETSSTGTSPRSLVSRRAVSKIRKMGPSCVRET